MAHQAADVHAAQAPQPSPHGAERQEGQDPQHRVDDEPGAARQGGRRRAPASRNENHMAWSNRALYQSQWPTPWSCQQVVHVLWGGGRGGRPSLSTHFWLWPARSIADRRTCDEPVKTLRMPRCCSRPGYLERQRGPCPTARVDHRNNDVRLPPPHDPRQAQPKILLTRSALGRLIQ